MNPASGHPNREQLAAFLQGLLEPDEQSAMTRHVETCAACCEVLREIPDDAFLARLRLSKKPLAPVRFERTADYPLPPELRDHPRYKISKCLGAGGMGLVYRAEHRLMGRTVALKIIHRELCRLPQIVERFRQEVQSAARLSHPNIVTAYDAEQAGEVHFLVMEYVDGVDLAKLVLKQGPLSVAHACNYIRQAAKGLQHAFEAGMVHRDIKPHNLMVTRKGRIKILDFGLARLAGEARADHGLPASPGSPGLTTVGRTVGTPDYMAPEQALNSRQTDIRADLYSLGCTFYFLLTGQSPFAQGPTLPERLAPQNPRPRPIIELRGDLPRELLAVLDRLMAYDPAERFQTPAEVVKALAPFAKSAPVAAPAKPSPKSASVRALPEVHDPSAFFLARCPFCSTSIHAPDKASGVSIPCPRCGSYFTAVPEEQGGRAPWPNPGGLRKKP